MHFGKALFLLSFVVSSFAATVTDVKNQITSLSSQLNTIISMVQAFPEVGGSTLQALSIQTVVMALIVGVGTLMAVVKAVPLPISEKEGRDVLDSFHAIEPTIIAASKALVSKRPAFSILSPLGFPPGGALGLIKRDLADLKTSLNAAEDAIEHAAPESLRPEGNALRGRINAVLESSIAAYA